MLWYDLQPRLLRYFRVVAPGAAEDLASDTWLRIIRGIGRFQGSEPAFQAWVFTIARRQVLDWRRQVLDWRRQVLGRAPAATQDLPVTGLAEPLAPDDPAADSTAAKVGPIIAAAGAIRPTRPTGWTGIQGRTTCTSHPTAVKPTASIAT
jgi:DNA-directed RNA polymerase specialized sigma24 family protein